MKTPYRIYTKMLDLSTYGCRALPLYGPSLQLLMKQLIRHAY